MMMMMIIIQESVNQLMTRHLHKVLRVLSCESEYCGMLGSEEDGGFKFL
jgi:hypothetical protein